MGMEFKIIELEEDDVLVFDLPEGASFESFDRSMKSIRRVLPAPTRLLLMQGCEVSILRGIKQIKKEELIDEQKTEKGMDEEDDQM